MSPNMFNFIGGDTGLWKVIQMNTLCGAPLDSVPFIHQLPFDAQPAAQGAWNLTGFTSNIRYTEKEEREKLVAIQADLGRPSATHAAMIPIKKSNEWWALAQDERRKIFEQKSHHTEIGLKYLPAIARRLYHAKDIGQPFDFITWFEFAPEDTAAFDALLHALRATEEWSYVEREIDIRLIKQETNP